jgi:hypothetical protein
MLNRPSRRYKRKEREMIILDCFPLQANALAVRNDEQKKAKRHCEERSDEAKRHCELRSSEANQRNKGE